MLNTLYEVSSAALRAPKKPFFTGLISVASIQALKFDPDDTIWIGLGSAINASEIRRCLKDRSFPSLHSLEPFREIPGLKFDDPRLRNWHAGRIASLTLVADLWAPIDIHIQTGSARFMSYMPIEDGNHRLMAAEFLKMKFIRASMSGSEEDAKALALI